MDDVAGGVRLKLAGVAIPTICVHSLEATTVHELLECIAQELGMEDTCTLKLIVGGRRLADDARVLKDCGITPSTRILVLGGHTAAQRAQLAAQDASAKARDERQQRLNRLRQAAGALAKRSGIGDVGDDDHHDFSLENQAGEAVLLDRADREALVMGLSLHDKGSRTLQQGGYKDALDELLLAEEAFGCCAASVVDAVDNIALLKLDIVWCHFQMRDAGSLGAAQERLATARACLQRAHGPNLERLKVLHGNFSPELATYVRLELLEGVAAYHAGNRSAARAKLGAAQAKWERLQLSDDHLAELLAMGFSSSEARRALRFCQGDTAAAVALVMEQQAAAERRAGLQEAERKLRRQQKRLGRTAGGARVDMRLLERISLLGYERALAAEALRQADNDANAALDMLGNAMTNAALQEHLALQASHKRHRDSVHNVDEEDLARLVSMGFGEARARRALAHLAEAGASTGDAVQAAMERMLADPEGAHDAAAEGPGGDAPTSSAAGAQGGDGGPPEERDQEMEAELTAAARSDPLSAYDLDLSGEGAAIREYIALLEAGGG